MFIRIKKNEIFEYKWEGTIKSKIPILDDILLEKILKSAEYSCEKYLEEFSNGWTKEL